MAEVETWKAHPEYPIDVSTHGRIRSQRTGKFKAISYSIRGGATAPSGYKRASTGVGTARAYVHTLVLETFVGPRPEGHEADHQDFDPSNNSLDNLRWLPKEENQARRKARANFLRTR